MAQQDTPPILSDLMAWCLNRVPGRESRNQRMALMLQSFRDVLNDEIPIITVAGTSGKGSVCAMLEAVLLRGGLVPGVCMKPHLSSFCERIRIGGVNVSADLLESHTQRIWARLEQFVATHGRAVWPSLFESIMLIAGSIFRELGVNVCVIEAAVGGSNDASSQLPSILSILTSVALDHQDILGDSLEAIAVDKAGIVRPGSTLISGAGVIEAVRPIVERECRRRGARFIQATADHVSMESEFRGGQRLKLHDAAQRGLKQDTLDIRFPGIHQLLNFASVCAATQALNEMNLIDESALLGVEDAFLPGRFEYIPGNPAWLLDVAHNVASIEALIETTMRQFAGQELIAVVGGTLPHDYAEFISKIVDLNVPVGFISGFPKAVSTSQLASLARSNSQVVGLFETPVQCVDCLQDNPVAKQATILVTGSLFLVGCIRSELIRRNILVERLTKGK